MRNFTHIIRTGFFSLFAISLILSCKRDRTEPVDSNNYYPLEVGRFLVYDVKEEVYSAGQANPVKKSWQEKDEVDRVSTDEKGIPTYTISRSRRNTATEYWQKEKEFTVQKYPDKLLTNIDNQTFFSLALPVDPKVKWNGNSYNNLDAQNYHYEDLNKPVTVGSQSFDKAMVVVERKDTSIINRYIGIKHYGLGVGLISDDQTAFELCQNDDCIGSGKIESGKHRSRIIVEFGKRL
ncbi:hypothetical protein MUK70_19440 [Dyadobacter chenwenxiniae]|uniref:Lipoprotein n=1 Tax=Dyadobacter chenwenxiniae TaxID=2906456 RepID=A0A9X1PJB9_9BACT|nr:hypothetical protein [Dyadobacter chenwenxiniae]MCF0061415.1 hypothetical protein [Dyadobacter chenwenxiniae]UON81236.1 hypothetical protein MUK70_19440 [Dyadobacter chenwenxiniae]